MTEVSQDEAKRFCVALDESNRVEVSDWEAKFLETALGWRTVFSPKQMTCILRMMDKYADRIGFVVRETPLPQAAKPAAVEIQDDMDF